MSLKYYNTNRFFKNEIDSYLTNPQTTNWDWIRIHKGNDPSIVLYDIDFFDPVCNHCPIVNQLSSIDCLGNKKLQYNFVSNHNQDRPKFVPHTIPFYKKNLTTIQPMLNHPSRRWIMKPENSMARDGVYVVSSSQQVNNILNNNQSEKWILQEYIENPLLYGGKKFHLRIYAIVILDKNKISVYVYQEGFIYLATKPYVSGSVDNQVNLSGEDHPTRVKVFPSDFINMYGRQSYLFILPQIDKIVKQCIYTVRDELSCPNQSLPDYLCFKMLGFDILCNTELELFLAEINARQISLKYPPPGYKQRMYSNILSLILTRSKFIPQVTSEFANHYVSNSENAFRFIGQWPRPYQPMIIERFEDRSPYHEKRALHSTVVLYLAMILVVLLFLACYTQTMSK